MAVVQSNYIPWKGYFDIISQADTFVFLDTVQFTKNDWRNRNKIKTANGPLWLTVPVLATGQFGQPIKDVAIRTTTNWQQKHWKSIQQSYRNAPYFDQYREYFEKLYCNNTWENLSLLNTTLIQDIARMLEIETTFVFADQIEGVEEPAKNAASARTERLISLLTVLGAKRYLSGPSAADYIEPDLFASAGIALTYMDYSGYPEYPQQHGAFDHQLSVIDVLFHCGPEAPDHVWRWRKAKRL